MEFNELKILEEKIYGLLDVISKLRTENQQIKSKLEEGVSSEIIFTLDKKKQIKEKIEGMLELLEKFQTK